MDKQLSNQNGYALVLVLLIIAVMGILTPPLVNSVLNNAKQFQRSEENIQLNKLIDMGKMYARNSIIDEINNLPTTSISDGIDTLSSELSNVVKPLDSSQNNQSFAIRYDSFDKQGDQLMITYTLTGGLKKSNQEVEEKSETETFILKLSGSGSGDGGSSTPVDWGDLDEDDFSDSDKFPNQYPDKVNFGRNTTEIDGNTNFAKEVKVGKDTTITVNGGAVLQDGSHMSNDGHLKVNGHFYATDGKLFLNQGSSLIIEKNAWFKNVEIQFPTGSTICVVGEIKEWDVSGQGNKQPPSPEEVDSCDQAGSGIYYVGQYFDDIDGGESGAEWGVVGSE